MLGIVGDHKVLSSLHAAEVNLALQPTIIQIFSIRSAYYIHLVSFFFHLHKFINELSSANRICKLSYLNIVSLIDLSSSAQLKNALACDN